MSLNKSKKVIFHFFLIVFIIVAFFEVIPGQAIQAESSVQLPGEDIFQIQQFAKENAASNGNTCLPGSGWMWALGPALEETSAQVQRELSEMGIDSSVDAQSYGEIDSCGNYSHRGVDFTVRLADSASDQLTSQQSQVANISPILRKHGQPTLGNVKLISSQGTRIPFEINEQMPVIQAANVESPATDILTRNVYVIVYDPLLRNGQKLSQYLGWNDHATITQQTVNFFKQATNNRMNYVITTTNVVTSGWPALADGYIYTEDAYMTAVSGGPHHEPTGVDYNKIVNDPQFDLCGKVSRGEIDEVWIYNGPWFGFYESTLAGPGAYWYNSPSVPGPYNCNRLLPIMGPSPERGVDEAVHNFTHRAESTMSRVYGGWQQNSTITNWNKFALVKAQSPNYSYSGCGSSHYPPNATSDYNYSNPGTVPSNCEDFSNYPNLSDPLTAAKQTTCTAWGCSQLGFFSYWFGHFPAFAGCGPDSVANDWWRYLASPAEANYPSNACQVNTHWISGNVGTGFAVLNYTDGTPKSVTADASGNYSLMVSNNWSGTVTPFRVGYTFTPPSRSYTGIQIEQYNQNYTAQPISKYYVNLATGNNSNSCTTAAAPCRNIQEAVNKAGAGSTVYVTAGTYIFSTNPIPNVVVIDTNLTLSGGWNSGFSSQTGASIIDGSNMNNGILVKSGTVTVENFIVQNSASFNGGAIYIVNGNFILRRSTVRNNQADSNGAGIFLDNGKLTVINSTISGNRAASSGGGIYASLNSSTSVNLQNSTIAYNQASLGGGISRVNGTYDITNTIIANNVSSGNGPDCAGTVSTAGFNIIENMSGCSISSGSNNLNVDPQIDSNPTGTLLVHALLPGSPAINAGTLTGCPVTDQQGTARPQGGSCDIGAFEYMVDTAPVVSSIKRGNPNPTGPADVTFIVIFSKPVTGVRTTAPFSNFALPPLGVKDATVKAVNGSGNTYTVTVNTGQGDGMVCLDVVDNDSIKDLNNTPLGGLGEGNGNFSTGESYTVLIGADTVGVFRPSNGLIYLKNTNQTGYADIAINYGMGGDYPISGDWDGDGVDSIGIYRKGSFYLRNSNTIGYADVVFPFSSGLAGDQPVAGDWNGDGIDTIGVYNSKTITFYLRNSNTSGPADYTFRLGVPGDVGIAGDWTGKGYDTVGVFRPSNGIIFLKNANDTGYADIAINYGQGGDKPVTGDWNNDGVDTIGILRGNMFYLRNSNTVGYADASFALGISGDMPIAGNWDGIP